MNPLIWSGPGNDSHFPHVRYVEFHTYDDPRFRSKGVFETSALQRFCAQAIFMVTRELIRMAKSSTDLQKSGMDLQGPENLRRSLRNRKMQGYLLNPGIPEN